MNLIEIEVGKKGSLRLAFHLPNKNLTYDACTQYVAYIMC